MSDNLPFEIQVDIMNRLPVKSLIQFRSVCKSWKSLIDSSDFIACYSAQHTQVHHLLVVVSNDFQREYVSVVDDDTFPQHKVSVFIPLLVKMLKASRTIGCSHGLFCLYGGYANSRGDPISGTVRAVIWNPSIGKAVEIIVPNVANGLKYGTILGFGVCGESNDPKIVKITHINSSDDLENISCIPWQVEVFTLSTRVWRSPYSNLPRKSIKFVCKQVVVDGFLYWLAVDRYRVEDEFEMYNLIVSFDMITEEFKEINLPDRLANQSSHYLSISKLRNSLVLLEHGTEAGDPVIVVWMMEDGVLNLFTKLSDINDYASISGFRNSGEPVFECSKDDSAIRQLVVYEPHSKHIGYFGIEGFGRSVSVYPYMETLLLLDQPNLTVYNEMRTLKI